MAEEDKYSRNFILPSSPSPGYCFTDASNNASSLHNPNHPIQAFGSDPEIYNLATGMEMIGFNMMPSSKPPNPHHQNHDDHILGPSSSSKPINDPSTSTGFFEFQTKPEFNDWEDHQGSRFVVDDSSFRCLFPSDAGPSRGLSLSLNSVSHGQGGGGGGGGGGGEGGFCLGKYLGGSPGPGHEIRSSKYLAPAQQLLNEFCSLEITDVQHHSNDPQRQKQHKSNHNTKDWVNGETINACGSSSSSKQSHPCSSLDFVQLQKRKAKLLSMLDEVDRRYKHYCDQMKAVVSSFEAVAGNGAASVYSAVAANAMSRHFRRLRDGIVDQIKSSNRAMGEKDGDAIRPGMTKGETPRLRILDQTLRQQRALQQMNMGEGSLLAWRPQRGLPEQSVSVLRAWLFEHFLHPYPSDVDKHILARQTGLSRSQVSNWFINARVRLWKPMVEEMYMEETKDPHQKQQEEEQDQSMNISSSTPLNASGDHQNPPSHSQANDHKPAKMDPESLSSMISTTASEKNNRSGRSKKTLHSGMGRVSSGEELPFGAVELDFTNYNQQCGSNPVSNYMTNIGAQQNFRGGGVSLTLGLKQEQGGRGSNGVSLAFSPSQSSLFYSRGHIEDYQPGHHHQYSSLLDGSTTHEVQNLPYRNLMGAQLLHDLAG